MGNLPPSQVRKLASGNSHKFPEVIVEVKVEISVGEMRYISLSLFPFNLKVIVEKKTVFKRNPSAEVSCPVRSFPSLVSSAESDVYES